MSGQFSDSGVTKEAPGNLTKVVEGFAAVLFPPAKKSGKIENAEVGAEDQSIFYNPAQVVNRDLSICVISTFSAIRAKETRKKGGTGDQGISILEALSATGLRAIRYWKEIPGVRKIIANDLDAEAVECIHRNCAFNEVPTGEPGIVPNCDDAILLMQRLAMDQNLPYRLAAIDPATGHVLPNRPLLQCEKVDVIDLDPYGTASPFIDSAMGAAKEGALMLVTCTDSAILCGNYPETCFGKYGTVSVKVDSCHEVAVRIVLSMLEQTANRHRKYIQPLLSLHIDFYVRVFIRVWEQPAEVKRACCKLGLAVHCTRCPFHRVLPLAETRLTRKSAAARADKRPREGDSSADLERETYPEAPPRDQPMNTHAASAKRVPTTCEACGSRTVISTPIYASPIHDHSFLQSLLSVIEERASKKQITAVERVTGLVKAAIDEVPNVPLFYSLPEVSSVLKMHCPPTPIVVGALTRMGYRCSQVNCLACGIKTDAPPAVLFGVMKHYKRKNEGESAPPPTSPAEGSEPKPTATNSDVLTIRYPEIECDLSYDKKYDWRSKVSGVTKFVPNAPFWGPKRRHQGIDRNEDGEGKEEATAEDGEVALAEE
jgi:tRNA(guanine-26,N2-N2) methyltransferase